MVGKGPAVAVISGGNVEAARFFELVGEV
jgi:hypothetical protein